MSSETKSFEDLNIERWGTFSVKDHADPKPFVAEVLLYDRLVIPYPPNMKERQWWVDQKWKPELLHGYFSILKDKAIAVPWDAHRQQMYATRFSVTRDVGKDVGGMAQKDIPYQQTRHLLTDLKALPTLPEGVDEVRAVAAYPSWVSFENEVVQAPDKGPREHAIGLAMAHEFFIPSEEDPRPGDELLREAVDLTSSKDFKEKRGKWYKWQEKVIRYGLTTKNALQEMKDYYSDYSKLVKKKKKHRAKKFGFLCLKVALGVLPGLIAANLPLAVAGGAAISTLEFSTFEWKLDTLSGDNAAAAMFYDARKHFGWK